jgi:FixJ family two-component response regulator
LLLVDDEDNIVAALKRLLRRDGYHIVTASSAVEGLQRLAEQEVDVIVSDQRMPGMTGVDFLHRAKALYPDTMRLVLSGYTELQSIIDAVNEGAIYKFLTKPWDDQLLRSHVAEAFRQKELADDNRRLAREVETANADLAKLNERLERLLGEQNEHAELLAAGADGMRGLLDEMPLALLGIDPDGLVAYANRHAEQLLGARGSPLGQSFIATLPAAHNGNPADPHPPGSCVEVDGAHFWILSRPLADRGQARGKLLVLLPCDRPNPTPAPGRLQPCAIAPAHLDRAEHTSHDTHPTARLCSRSCP